MSIPKAPDDLVPGPAEVQPSGGRRPLLRLSGRGLRGGPAVVAGIRPLVPVHPQAARGHRAGIIMAGVRPLLPIHPQAARGHPMRIVMAGIRSLRLFDRQASGPGNLRRRGRLPGGLLIQMGELPGQPGIQPPLLGKLSGGRRRPGSGRLFPARRAATFLPFSQVALRPLENARYSRSFPASRIGEK